MTNAGRVILERVESLNGRGFSLLNEIDILAIEAEAIAAERARIRAAVEGLLFMQSDYAVHTISGSVRAPMTAADWVEAYRAAVLAAIDGGGE